MKEFNVSVFIDRVKAIITAQILKGERSIVLPRYLKTYNLDQYIINVFPEKYIVYYTDINMSTILYFESFKDSKNLILFGYDDFKYISYYEQIKFINLYRQAYGLDFDMYKANLYKRLCKGGGVV